MNKNILKHLLVIAVALIITQSFFFLPMSDNLKILFVVLVLSVFIISYFGRREIWFKPYFTSRFNIFAAKFRQHQEFDFSKDILFEKLIEVLQLSGFKIVYKDMHKGEIFATSPISLSSWGENIYIDINETNNKCILNFCSVCFFQIYSWGKNERNYQNLIQEFEESLII
jgi:hypothetical protein